MDDEKIVKKLVKYNYNIYFNASPELQKDDKIFKRMLMGLSENPQDEKLDIIFKQKLPKVFSIDSTKIQTMIHFNGLFYAKLAKKYQTSENFHLAVANNPRVILFLPSLKQDQVYEAIEHGFTDYSRLPDQIKNDPNVISKFLQNDIDVKKYIPDLEPRAFVLQKINENWEHIANIHPYYQNDREIVLKAVMQNSAALSYAPLRFRDDKEIILRAIQSGTNRNKSKKNKCLLSRIETTPKRL